MDGPKETREIVHDLRITHPDDFQVVLLEYRVATVVIVLGVLVDSAVDLDD